MENKPSTYKDNNSLEERKNQFQRYKEQYPTKVPIILEKHPKCNLKPLDRPEVLMEENQTGTQLIQTLKQKLDANNQSQNLYIFYSNTNVQFPLDQLLKNIAEKHTDQEDGFLYLTYKGQETYG